VSSHPRPKALANKTPADTILAMIGDATRRHWAWAVLMALALELGMLLTPYPQVFNIPVTTRFVMVTVAAHAIFGIGLGLAVRWLATSRRFLILTA